MSLKFDNLTRIGEDSCGLSQQNVQNKNANEYLLQNYFLSDCGMKRSIDFATTQPNINFKGGFGLGAGGCNVMSSSELLIGSIQTNPKCRLNLQERPFKTIPYLGRGSGNPTLESRLMQGDQMSNKKSSTLSAEKSFIPYSNYPLIAPIKESITNPEYLVEGVASKGWVRGGLPSRDIYRKEQFSKQNSAHQYN